MAKKKIIAPSILNANFLNLGQELHTIAATQYIQWLHIDVMDNHAVPNFTFGPLVISAIKQKFNFCLDGHMMVDFDPTIPLEKCFRPFIEAGIDHLNWKYSSFVKQNKPIKDFLHLKQKYPHIKIGLAIDPNVELNAIKEFLPYLDIVLIMSVNSGFGGQTFQPEVLNKTRLLKTWIKKNDWNLLIEMDGGIKEHNARLCFNAGADIIVVGTYIFHSFDYKKAIENLLKHA